MVCFACLLPLFLIPIVNILPLLFDLIMGKIYGVFGWEYRKPVKTPPACPYKPAANKSSDKVAPEPALVALEPEPVVSDPAQKSVGVVDDSKLD